MAEPFGRMRMPPEPTAVAPTAARRTTAAAWVVVSLALVVGLSGCSLCQQARRTVLYEPLNFGWKLDRARSLKTYRQWAANAWRIEKSACPELAASSDYVEGFQDGFVDLIYAGGDGTPPPIPPRKYWNMGWRGPTGQVAAQQWFAGFRHGAQVARDGGYRQQATVESSFRTTAHESFETPMVGPPSTPIEELGPPGESLPPPMPGPTPMPTLPDQSTNGAASPASPPAVVDPPAAADGAARQFRRALDVAAAATQPAAPAVSPPADAADETARPLELPTTDGANPQSPADIESP